MVTAISVYLDQVVDRTYPFITIGEDGHHSFMLKTTYWQVAQHWSSSSSIQSPATTIISALAAANIHVSRTYEEFRRCTNCE